MSSNTQLKNKNYATFWQRLMANFSDELIISIPRLMGIYYLFQAKDLSDFFYRAIVAFFLIFIPSLLFEIFYHTWFLSNSGATPGKQIWGLKIVDESGEYLSAWMAFFREMVAKKVSFGFFCLGFLWMIKEKDRLTWHDMFAGSYAIKTNHSWNSLLVTIVLIAAIILIILATISQLPEFIDLLFSALK